MPRRQDGYRPGAQREGASPPRPEAMLLAFFGAHLLDRRAAVAVGSTIEVLGRLGVGEHATRAVLKRMGERGFLRAVRTGRRAYVRLTPHAEEVLREGGERLSNGILTQDWDGRWTLLAFSVPESHRQDRQALRAQLTWAGFGLLHSGLWIAPSSVDVAGTLAGLGLLGYVEIFKAEALVPDDPALLAAEAWDLSGLAGRYRDFTRRWERGADPGSDALCGQILLEAQWLLLIRDDPRLPLGLLPGDWPGIRADELFRSLRGRFTEPARLMAGAELDWL